MQFELFLRGMLSYVILNYKEWREFYFFHGGMKKKKKKKKKNLITLLYGTASKPNHTFVWNREAVSYKSVISFFFFIPPWKKINSL